MVSFTVTAPHEVTLRIPFRGDQLRSAQPAHRAPAQVPRLHALASRCPRKVKLGASHVPRSALVGQALSTGLLLCAGTRLLRVQ